MEPVDIGMQLARAEFRRRGSHAEAHLSEAELAALISIGAERAQKQGKARIADLEAQLRTARDDLRERVEHEVERAYEFEGSTAPVRELVRALSKAYDRLDAVLDAQEGCGQPGCACTLHNPTERDRTREVCEAARATIKKTGLKS